MKGDLAPPGFALVGQREHFGGEHYVWTPAWQECVCGANEFDYNESVTRRYNPCCQMTFLDGRLIAVGRVCLTNAMRPNSRPSTDRVRAVIADCASPPPGMTTALYRRFDGDGILLYVGVSDDLPARSRWHERRSPWAQFVANRTTDWFPSRATAEAAEQAAIKAELPLFNRQHAMPGQIEAAARYLIKEGRVRLVAPEEAQK